MSAIVVASAGSLNSQSIAEALQTSRSATQVAGNKYTDNSNSSGIDQADVSEIGKMMSALQTLASTDPSAFKQAAQTIADNLAQSALETTDEFQKQAFTDISAKFAKAAETGDMSSLTEISQGPVAAGAGGDTVDISDQGRELASQGNSTGTGSQSQDTASETGTQQAGGSSQTTTTSGGSTASAAQGASGGSTSTSSDIDDQIDDVESKISKVQAQLSEAKQKVKKTSNKQSMTNSSQQGETDSSQQGETNSVNTGTADSKNDGKANSVDDDRVKQLTIQLADLNAQLTLLENEKLQSQ